MINKIKCWLIGHQYLGSPGSITYKENGTMHYMKCARCNKHKMLIPLSYAWRLHEIEKGIEENQHAK